MLYHRESGRGQPLVLMHGLFGSLENLGGLTREFAKQYQVYSLDLPNHGRSPHSDAMSLSSMADDLSEWFDAQGLSSAILLGHSLGGKVMMEFALANPDKVQALVVIDIAPVHYGPHHEGVMKGLQAIDPSAIKSRSEADQILSEYVPELPIRSFLLKNLSKDSEGFSWRMNLKSIQLHYPELIQENRWSTLNKPVLFVKGELSDYILEDHKENILKRFPNTELKVISGTGHWLHAEKPELVSKIILKFLSSCPGCPEQ